MPTQSKLYQGTAEASLTKSSDMQNRPSFDESHSPNFDPPHKNCKFAAQKCCEIGAIRIVLGSTQGADPTHHAHPTLINGPSRAAQEQT
jgi:hypothetical protein